jgi:hypothetical protein
MAANNPSRRFDARPARQLPSDFFAFVVEIRIVHFGEIHQRRIK